MNTLATQSLNNSVEDSLATPALMLTREEFESHLFRQTGEEKWKTYAEDSPQDEAWQIWILLSLPEGPKIYRLYWDNEYFIDAVIFFHRIRNMPCPLISHIILYDIDEFLFIELMTYYFLSPSPEIPEKTVVYAPTTASPKNKFWDEFLPIAQSFQEMCDKTAER